MMHAVIEVDIVDARTSLRKIGRETGREPSVTAFVIAACARAVQRNPVMRAYRDLRNRLVLFEDVDVSMTVERVVGGASRVIPTIIRAANRKTVTAIGEEIDFARSAEADKTGESHTEPDGRWNCPSGAGNRRHRGATRSPLSDSELRPRYRRRSTSRSFRPPTQKAHGETRYSLARVTTRSAAA